MTIRLASSYGASGNSYKPQRWGERLSALRNIPRLLGFIWETHKSYAVMTIFFRLLLAFSPIAILWVGKLIIDTITASHSGIRNEARLWRLIALEITIVVIRELLIRGQELTEKLLSDRFSQHTSIRLISHASSLDLSYYEDPEFYDRLERARAQTGGSLLALTRLLGIGQDMVTFCTLGLTLFVYDLRLLLPLILIILPSIVAESHCTTLEYQMFCSLTGRRRQLDYLRYVGASNSTAKEVQLFGLSPWIIARFRRLSQALYQEGKRFAVYKTMILCAMSIIGALGYYAAYIVILTQAFKGAISLGMMTLLAGSYAKANDLINSQMRGASNLFSQALYLRDLFGFLDLKPAITSPQEAPHVPRPIRKGIEFVNVSFRYPGRATWAVRDLNIFLRPGEKIALVGENGAGKTTVVKLLARLYDPTEGRILIDGKDIRTYDLQSLRRMIGAVFQDFIRYSWRFDENIGVGEVEKVDSYLESISVINPNNGGIGRFKTSPAEDVNPPPVPNAIISAAERSLAATLLPRLVKGYGQVLGRSFDDGIELSGGEWQKIALGRAYMRDAQLLILDEPTAALDARAEYEVFKRFSQLMEGRTALIISHRFSTVRMADRIIVLKNGQTVEEGTHDELIAQQGIYSELFTLQAKGYA
jgi:ATP-binding cassette, subfamily B, bacterial